MHPYVAHTVFIWMIYLILTWVLCGNTQMHPDAQTCIPHGTHKGRASIFHIGPLLANPDAPHAPICIPYGTHMEISYSIHMGPLWANPDVPTCIHM